jgi:hypothetical protein
MLNQARFRADLAGFFAAVDFEVRLDFFALPFRFAAAFGRTRSGNSALPAPRFHSSKVSGEILPSTNNSANFLRCALLLIGIEASPLTVELRRRGVGSQTNVRVSA